MFLFAKSWGCGFWVCSWAKGRARRPAGGVSQVQQLLPGHAAVHAVSVHAAHRVRHRPLQAVPALRAVQVSALRPVSLRGVGPPGSGRASGRLGASALAASVAAALLCDRLRTPLRETRPVWNPKGQPCCSGARERPLVRRSPFQGSEGSS